MSIPHVRRTVMEEKEYAIFLQIDDGEWDYLRKKSGNNSWSINDPVLVFRNKDDAQHEANKWNTASVVEWQYGMVE